MRNAVLVCYHAHKIHELGVMVLEAVSCDLAAKAGPCAGDVIVTLDGAAVVEHQVALTTLTAASDVGATVRLTAYSAEAAAIELVLANSSFGKWGGSSSATTTAAHRPPEPTQQQQSIHIPWDAPVEAVPTLSKSTTGSSASARAARAPAPAEVDAAVGDADESEAPPPSAVPPPVAPLHSSSLPEPSSSSLAHEQARGADAAGSSDRPSSSGASRPLRVVDATAPYVKKAAPMMGVGLFGAADGAALPHTSIRKPKAKPQRDTV